MASGKAYDVVAVGVGGMGAAACWQLARRGQRVLGLERFDIPHAQGSSHGVTRIIRLAYYEDPAYVPLLVTTGSLHAGPADSDVFRGSLESCEEHAMFSLARFGI